MSRESDTDCVFLIHAGFISDGIAHHPSVFLSLRNFIPIFDFFSVCPTFLLLLKSFSSAGFFFSF